MAERALSASVLAAIASGSVRPFLLFEGEYVAGSSTAFLRLFTGVGTLSWDGKEWVGGRDLLSISPIRESTSLEAIGFSVRLSGMPTDKLSVFLQSMRKNKAGRLWLGFMRPVAYLDLPGTSGNIASTPDSAAVSVTGDIDIRMKVSLNNWTPSPEHYLINHGLSGSRSWIFGAGTAGRLVLYLSFDGTTWGDGGSQHLSTVVHGFANGSVQWIRVTRASSTGAILYYTSSDGVAWTQLGVSVASTAGALFDSVNPLAIAGWGNGANFAGKCYYAEVRNGIDGPVVAKFDPLRFSSGELTAAAETGEVWTINQSGSPAAVIVPQSDEVIADPYPLRRGRFDMAPISRDAGSGTMTIEARYEGPLARLLIPNVRHYTHEDQQLRLAGDKGFDQVEALQDTQDLWGPEVPAVTRVDRFVESDERA